MRFGLLAKVLIISVTVTLAGVIAVFWSSSHLFSRAYVEALQSRSQAIAQGLRIQLDRVLALGIRLEDLSGFEKQCREAVASYDGIESAVVIDRNGQILFASDPSRHGERFSDTDILRGLATGIPSTVAFGGDGKSGYAAIVPVVSTDGTHIASVLVAISASVVDGKLREMQYGRMAVGVISLIVGFGVFMLALSFFVVRPLLRLTNSVKEIRADTTNLARRIELDSRDEFEDLAGAFNELMQVLQATTVSKSSLAEAYDALKASESKYRELLRYANVIILRLAPDGTITYFNEYAESFFGFAADEIVGRHVLGTILPPFESESGRDLGAVMSAILAEPQRYATSENENMTRDGRRVVIQWANRVIPDAAGSPIGLLCIGHDVTEKKFIDRELDQHRHHLEELVFSRTTELAAARDAAESASRAKSVFLANMSHELRTPMNAIMGMTNLVLRRATDPKQVDYLNKVIKASQHLLALISDILDISRIEADRLSIEERDFSPAQIVDEVLRMQDGAAQEKGLTLAGIVDPSVPAVVCGDPVRLRQIVLNFVGNAIKFSEHGCIRVRSSVIGEDSHAVNLRVEVSDQGIGISKEQQARLFQPFIQIDDSLTRKHGGSGLGLAISRRIAHLMDGEVGVDSEPGTGSCFWATVKLKRTSSSGKLFDSAVDADARESLIREFGGTRILVVEDEPSNREVAEMLLRDAGLIPDLAVDGREAVACASKGGHALILMDLQMPVMNGLDATLAIRQLPGLTTIPILAMTANAFEADRERCRAAGMDDHLAKPVVPAMLYTRVLHLLRGRAQQSL